MDSGHRIKKSLEVIYGAESATKALALVKEVMKRHKGHEGAEHHTESGQEYFDQSDIVLITYGDSFLGSEGMPLHALNSFLDERLKDLFSSVHILPFFPYSSDDGFSVCDYYEVNPELGTWDDIQQINNDFKLMADLVVNHVSAKGDWFSRYLAGEKEFSDLAIEVDPAVDLSQVTRPRTSPLLTQFTRGDGSKVHVWTTFSDDQVDINFADPAVMAKMLDVLLFYVSRGARLIRLDAIAYLWKEIGTNCIHLPETHEVVKLMRSVLDVVAPEVVLITETNVPHEENVSYFGDGSDEAQMVYNFSLPPLLLHSFLQQDTGVLSNWARQYLNIESSRCTFFNFTASHDGIGVRPLEGIIPTQDIQALAGHARVMGGDVSSKANPDGSESPYELNVTYVDAMGEPGSTNGDTTHARRFMTSQEIQFSLPGVPAVYIHSLLGSRNWKEGVEISGHKRRINRQRLDLEQVRRELDSPGSFRSIVFEQYSRLIALRKQQAAFHPNASLEIFDAGKPELFAFRRSGGGQTIHVIANIGSSPAEVNLDQLNIPADLEDILGGQRVEDGVLYMEPYRTSWLV